MIFVLLLAAVIFWLGIAALSVSKLLGLAVMLAAVLLICWALRPGGPTIEADE